MTICIMAICENNSKIIVASDRMLTIESFIEFEHELTKIEKLSSNCAAVTAGNALTHVDIFNNVKPVIKKSPFLSISEIAEEVKNSFIRQRKKKIEELFLQMRGYNIETFYENMVNLPESIYITLDDKIQNYDFNLDIIVGGVDDEGAHIYYIENPGTLESYDSVGYFAIGTGDIHATLTFISRDYFQEISTKESLYIIYEAKRISEKAPGVGKKTDIWIIDRNHIIQLSQKVIDSLNNIYNKKKVLEATQYKEIKDLIDELSIEEE